MGVFSSACLTGRVGFAVGSLRSPGRGVLDQRLPRRRRPRCRASQELAEMSSLGDPGAEMLRSARMVSPRHAASVP